MSLCLSVACGESTKSLERRARVLCFRLSRGEYVEIPAFDPVAEIYFELASGAGFRVAHGNAAGAVPEVL